MATIQLKRSAVPEKAPTTTDLALGEIAINTYDGNMFYKMDNGVEYIIKLAAADLNNVAPTTTGFIASTGAGLEYRTITGDAGPISVTYGNGVDGNPTIQFNPSSVSLTQLSGGINDLLPSQADNTGKFLTTDGSNVSWATVSASPGGSTGQLQYNNAGTFNGASNVTVAGGDLILAPSASPATATTTSTAIMRRSEIPYPALATNAIQNGNFTELYMQPHLGSCDIAWWNPPGNATTVPGVLGIAAMTAGGTVTARTVATTNVATRARRLGYVGAASVGATAGHYQPQRQWTTSDGLGAGGFYCVYRFAISDAALVPEARMFVGMSAENGAFAASQYFPANNYLGVGHDTGETSLKFIYNGSGTAPARSSLGSSFPVALNTLYEVRIYSYTATFAHIELVNLSNGASATMAITNTNQFPASSTLLAPRAWRTNNSVSTVVALDIASLYIEKPY